MPGAIEAKAELSVARACGFACLGIGTFMVGMMGEPKLAFKLGGQLTLLTCFILILKANLAARKPYKHTEVWLMLDQAERPRPEIAQTVISRALRFVFLRFALYSAALSVAMLTASLLLDPARAV